MLKTGRIVLKGLYLSRPKSLPMRNTILNSTGKRLRRAEILGEVLNPSEMIKPSMMGVRVTKNDDQVLIGKVVNSNEKEISLMLVGNSVVQIPRNEIKKTEDEKTSLMYEGPF